VSWVDLGPLAALPERGARCVRIAGMAIAVFRTSTGDVYALRDQCPHRGGPLSQGIVHGTRVTCPLHDWVIDLATGQATGADEGSTPTFNARVVDGRVQLELTAELLAKAS
jgi:nitrite reductase (NADH) small subunit